MLRFFELLYQAMLFALIAGPICYLLECILVRIYLYKKYGSNYHFYLKAYHWIFKLLDVTVMRGMPIQIKTSSKSRRIIAGKIIGLDDHGQIYVYCTDGVVVSYPTDKIDIHDISTSPYFSKDLEQS